MKQLLRNMLACGISLGGMTLMAVEEANYDRVEKDGRFEIRDYAPCIVAEVVIAADFEDAGNKAFRLLFDYISGNNKAQQEIAMTAPVAQEARSTKIAMTAPVGQKRVAEGYAVSFMMPAKFTMDTIPTPENPKVKLRQIPARRMAVVRYSGFWSEKKYLKYKAKLEAWLRDKGLTSVGEPVWARYNPPFMPWFMRRNEILIPVKAPQTVE